MKDGKQARDQLEYWNKKNKDLDTWKPGSEGKLLDETPTKKPSTTSV